jgi:hypothetical protein
LHAISNDSALVKVQIDQLSLEQALVDVEIATARAGDLTARLLESRLEIAEARSRILELEAELASLRRDYEGQRSSKAFKIAEKIWSVRRAIGV